MKNLTDKDIMPYLEDGYVVSPYYLDDDFKYFNKLKTIYLTKEDIRNLLLATSEEREAKLRSKDEFILVKYEYKYHITPQDLIEKFNRELNNEERPDYYELISWADFSDFRDNNDSVLIPSLDDKYYEEDKDGIEDYLFKKDDHIVSFIVRQIRTNLRENKEEEDLLSYIDFINDVLSKKEVKEEETIYELNTYSLILQSICNEVWLNHKITKECQEFYRRQLLINAMQNDPRAMNILGYEYYEGTNGFPLDMNESLYWLEKYFNITGDPHVARTIGYIYYYGRTTNGIPQRDKAFQYFAIGHIAGHNLEATYKLADCYLRGYGTPISHQAAYTLVNSIYLGTYNEFLNGEDTKFADVALRMGSFYKDGIYVKKDLKAAQIYYLEAKAAIKTRLEHMEYIGDRSVAAAISKNLEYVERELNIKDRVIKDGGYLINDFTFNAYSQKFTIKYKKGGLYISIKNDVKDNYYLINIPSIGFIERTDKIEFKIILDEDKAKTFLDTIKKHKIQEIYFNKNKFTATYYIKDQEYPNSITYNELIFYPQTIKELNKKYAIAGCEFYPGSKLYDYLCLGEPQIGNKRYVLARGERKEVTIKTIKYIYEDQLPLPYDKMNKI